MRKQIIRISVIFAAIFIVAASLALSSGRFEDALGLVDDLRPEEPEVDPSPAAAGVRGPAAATGMLGALAAAVEGVKGDEGPPPLHLTVPEHGPLLTEPPAYDPGEVPAGQARAHAYQYVSRIFDRPRDKPTALGFVRRGMVLHAGARVHGPGCEGSWYRLVGSDGIVCSRDGFSVSRTPQEMGVDQKRPDVAAGQPFRYGKARDHDVLRYLRVPTPEEEKVALAARDAGESLPDYVERKLAGVYLLAIAEELQDEGRPFLRTVRGRYIRAEQLEPRPLPPMRGEIVGSDNPLPIAFVFSPRGEDTPAELWRREGGARAVVGSADKHARFGVVGEETWDDTPVVVSQDGFAAPRDRVRLARRIERPERIPPGVKWVHVNHDEQTLVAYEGDEPVFATLVSSGKGADFATPRGLFQLREKHISATMNGPDPDEGFYEVEEVPWTQYYYDSFALHGAYWHNDFGNTRSHGCTNIAPVDARYLFYWTDDEVPAGWQALRKLEGTYVHMTRDLPPQE